MIKNKVKYSQLAFLLCVTLPAGKLLSLPSLAYRHTGRDFWIGMAIAVAVELLALFAVLWGISHTQEGETLKDVLEKTVGRFFSKAIILLFAVSFFLKFLYLLSDVMVLYGDIFVLKSDWTVFAAVALLAIWFILSRGFQVVARLGEALFIPVMICLIAISVLSLGDCSFEKLLPIAEKGAGNIMESFAYVGFAFGDGAILMALSGDVTRGKKKTLQTLLGATVGGIATVFVCIIYLALFGELAFFGEVAIARISQFNFNTSVTGRLDWLFISGWVIAVFLLLFLYARCFFNCVEAVFFKPDKKLSVVKGGGLIIFVCFALVVMILPLFVDFKSFIGRYFMEGFARYIEMGLTRGLAIAYPLLVVIFNKRNHRNLFRANNGQSAPLDFSVGIMEVGNE